MTIFQGRTAVLATMHGKEKVMAPLLERELGLNIVLPPDFNSDQFGTFSGEIERTGNQLEAARHKARAAMKLMNLDLGIASEGSFGSDPHIPFIQSNLELVVLIDDTHNIEITGQNRTPETNMAGQYVSSVTEALDFAKKIGFPEHGILIRKKEGGNNSLHKGITTEEELKQHVNKLLKSFFTKKIYLETDMRAHMNPTRIQNIKIATENLIENAKSKCPNCETPGFCVTDIRRGLPCCRCALPTESPLASIKKCQRCAIEVEVPIEHTQCEDPSLCERCNP